MKRCENGLRRSFRGPFFGALILVLALAFWAPHGIQAQSLDPRPPKRPIKLIFIHHSCGENWLSDAVALAFESSDGARNAGRLWIDDVTLLPAGR
ncbi:MAG: hypothetical protein ABIP48_20690 [Planctomycetota bacterium]